MQLRRVAVALGLFAPLLACAETPAEAPARRSLRPNDETSEISARGPTRAQIEQIANVEQPEPPVAAQHQPRPSIDVRVEISDAHVERGEDGRGELVAASHPVNVDLVRADGFPGRARDPELHVGQLRFTRYSHPAPDRMRFVVADRDLVPATAPITLQWGTDRVQLRHPD